MTTEQIRQRLVVIGITNGKLFQRKGVVTLRRAFFYRYQVKVDYITSKIREAFPKAKMLEVNERWFNFPRESYFEFKWRMK